MDINYNKFYANKTDYKFILFNITCITILTQLTYFINPFIYIILNSLCNLKLFMIYHDCGHNSFTIL